MKKEKSILVAVSKSFYDLGKAKIIKDANAIKIIKRINPNAKVWCSYKEMTEDIAKNSDFFK